MCRSNDLGVVCFTVVVIGTTSDLYNVNILFFICFSLWCGFLEYIVFHTELIAGLLCKFFRVIADVYRFGNRQAFNVGAASLQK